jgi:hypothetical protein
MRVSYLMPPHRHPDCQLHPGASQDLVATLPGWRSHIYQHTNIETYIKPNGDYTFNYIYQSNITQSLCISNYYTKNNYHLTQSL